MTTTAIMQPYFLPYIGYWQLIAAADIFVIYDDVNYIKGGWINRNRFLLNGAPRFFTLSLDQASPFKKINEITIQATSANKARIRGQWAAAYSKAPHYKAVLPFLETVLMNGEANLARFLQRQICDICSLLGIKTEIVMSSALPKHDSIGGQDRVINICKHFGTDRYINAIGGQSLYDASIFAACGISLSFLKTNFATYHQFGDDFVPGLSVVDHLMFCGQHGTASQVSNYELGA